MSTRAFAGGVRPEDATVLPTAAAGEPSGRFGLLPQHAALIRASGITDEVAQARGYVSVDAKATLARYGFAPAQRRVPGLLIPIYNVAGKVAFHQYRPDDPRLNSDGKPIKYETPASIRMTVDCHPFARPWLADPQRPLFVAEGARKADAAISRGLCCVALLGVWNWRGRNAQGGKVALPDWESVALNGRQIYVVFDSDVMVKPQVHQALARLKAFLESRGVQVALIYLPPGEGGAKVGLDDYLAAGHSVDELLTLATPALRTPSSVAPPIGIGERPNTRTPPDLDALKARAAPLLAAADPLEVFGAAVRAAGFGGDLGPALLVYLAVTSRVLEVRRGSMLPHLLLVGPPGAGKNFTLQAVLGHLPPEAYHIIDAGSPRALIYDAADLRHRVLVFGEADSLPAGEDNPAASAVRNLLADHHLHYDVVVRDPKTNDYITRHITKEGPTILITTSTRRLGEQLDSRLFTLHVPDDHGQVQAALRAQARQEVEEAAAAPPEALVAYQAYLQALAPWRVTVPFASELAEAIGRAPVAPRVSRDFARLLALVKAVAVLRHHRRRRDDQGRLVAEVDDYALVYDLVREVYAASLTGAGRGVREVVQAVETLVAEGKSPVTVSAVAERLSVAKSSASGRIRASLRGGWLVNKETRRGHPFDLALGEPLPPETGLPSPSALRCSGVRPFTDEKEMATWTA